MSETKQRIWPHYPLGDGKTEYIRADVAEADKQLAVAAALTEAADVAGRFYAKGQVTKPEDILALIPDAGAALDRYVKERSDEALEAERERCAKQAETYEQWATDFGPLNPEDVAEHIAAAIRHGSAISAQGET